MEKNRIDSMGEREKRFIKECMVHNDPLKNRTCKGLKCIPND